MRGSLCRQGFHLEPPAFLSNWAASTAVLKLKKEEKELRDNNKTTAPITILYAQQRAAKDAHTPGEAGLL